MATETTTKTKHERRNEKIRARFDHLSNEKHLKTERVLELLEEEFLPLSKGTLWLIITQTGYYKGK